MFSVIARASRVPHPLPSASHRVSASTVLKPSHLSVADTGRHRSFHSTAICSGKKGNRKQKQKKDKLEDAWIPNISSVNKDIKTNQKERKSSSQSQIKSSKKGKKASDTEDYERVHDALGRGVVIQ